MSDPTEGIHRLDIAVTGILMNTVAESKLTILYLSQRIEHLEEYATQQAAWAHEVTLMLHAINWASLATAFPGGGGANPPQTAPTWPPH